MANEPVILNVYDMVSVLVTVYRTSIVFLLLSSFGGWGMFLLAMRPQ